MSIAAPERPGPSVPPPVVVPPSRVDTAGWRGTGRPNQIRVLAGRSLRTLREPIRLAPSLIQPFILLVLFGQVFSSIAETPGFPDGITYIDYLLPAILVTTSVGAGLKSGAALTTDLRNGIIARFRAMPLHTSSILIARIIADTVLNAVELLIMVAVGSLLFGYDPPGGLLGTFCALLLGLLVGFTLGWVFMGVSAKLRNPEAVQTIGSLITFPLMFASSAFVTPDNLPTWLRVFAEVNPMSHAIDAARLLALGDGSLGVVITPVLSCAFIILIAAPLAIRSFRRP
jgi:ABC-2 type transport system permease protein